LSMTTCMAVWRCAPGGSVIDECLGPSRTEDMPQPLPL
jgi:hypothetical protein